MLRKKFDKVVKDLKCITFGELSYRLWDSVLKKSGIQKRIYNSSWMSDGEVLKAFSGRFSNKSELVKYLRERDRVNFFFSPNKRDTYKQRLNEAFPDQLQVLIKKAGEILEHRFFLLGREYQFDGSIDWFYTSGEVSWPFTHWCDIDSSGDGGQGDVRPLWELNRQQHFFTLGRAYWWTGDRRYAQEFTNQLKDWLSKNPPETGINWQSNLEIAIRSISWIWSFNFFLDSEALDDDTLYLWVKAFIHSARHLERHMPYSRYCMRNNHLIGDAAGLALIAQTFPELNQSGEWKKKALKVLLTELPRQIYPDGVNWEQSVVYHRFVLYLYFIVFRMEKLNCGDVPPSVWDYLEKMFDYLLWISKPDGSAPMIGDSDDGKAIVLGNESSNDLRPTISTGAVFFGRRDFKYVARKLSEETVWLMGLDAFEKWEEMKKEIPDKIFHGFNHGGYYLMRSGWEEFDSYILFKNGPHSPFHSHSDQLHVEMYAHGRDLLVDPGTFVYNGRPIWRNFFRGTGAHNTVMVDGQHQSVPYRSFRWLEIARPLDVQMFTGKLIHWLNGGHSGFNRLPDPVVHLRGILNIIGEYVIVLDEFSAIDNHKYEFFFHFPPGDAIIKENSCRFNPSKSKTSMFIDCPADERIICEALKGRDDNEKQGWVSYSYGNKLPAPVFICKTRITGPCHFVFVMGALSDSRGNNILVERKTGYDSTVIIIKQKDTYDIFGYSNDLSKSHTDEIVSDGKILFYRKSKTGRPVYLFSASGSYIDSKEFVTLKGNWLYIEIYMNGRNAVLSGEFTDSILLTSDLIENVQSNGIINASKVGKGKWILNPVKIKTCK